MYILQIPRVGDYEAHLSLSDVFGRHFSAELLTLDKSFSS